MEVVVFINSVNTFMISVFKCKCFWTRVPGALSLGVKRPGCEADCSPPCNAEAKNVWSYTSTSQYAFMVWCSVKAQGQLYLYCYLSSYYKVIFVGTIPLIGSLYIN
jgi:hypothetical protein